MSAVWRIDANRRIDVGSVTEKIVSCYPPNFESSSSSLMHDAPGVVSVRYAMETKGEALDLPFILEQEEEKPFWTKIILLWDGYCGGNGCGGTTERCSHRKVAASITWH
eukprot:scaffold55301_cov31-Attheya_sp.AAC.3